MAKYRKLPVVIEAVQFTGNDAGNRPQFEDRVDKIQAAPHEPVWLREALDRRAIVPREGGLLVKTKEGPIHASPGDWIIRGIEGELYPCKPDTFAKSYVRQELVGGHVTFPDCSSYYGGKCDCGQAEHDPARIP